MQEFIDMITQDSLVYGLICISLSVIIILVLVDKNLKDTRSFSEHSTGSWKALISCWSFALMIFIKGLFLLIN
jgi:hypothetical protein